MGRDKKAEKYEALVNNKGSCLYVQNPQYIFLNLPRQSHDFNSGLSTNPLRSLCFFSFEKCLLLMLMPISLFIFPLTFTFICSQRSSLHMSCISANKRPIS